MSLDADTQIEQQLPRIEWVTVDDDGELMVKFRNGAKLFFMARVLPCLTGATDEELTAFAIAPTGLSISWKELGVRLPAAKLIELACTKPALVAP
jgi:hypothetical protein